MGSHQGQSEEDPFSNTQLCPKHHPAYQDGAVGQEGSHPLENHPQATVGGDAQQVVTEEDVSNLFPQFEFCDMMVIMMTVMSVAKEKATMYTETFTVASSLSQSDMLQCSEDKFMVFGATWLVFIEYLEIFETPGNPFTRAG